MVKGFDSLIYLDTFHPHGYRRVKTEVHVPTLMQNYSQAWMFTCLITRLRACVATCEFIGLQPKAHKRQIRLLGGRVRD